MDSVGICTTEVEEAGDKKAGKEILFDLFLQLTAPRNTTDSAFQTRNVAKP